MSIINPDPKKLEIIAENLSVNALTGLSLGQFTLKNNDMVVLKSNANEGGEFEPNWFIYSLYIYESLDGLFDVDYGTTSISTNPTYIKIYPNGSFPDLQPGESITLNVNLYNFLNIEKSELFTGPVITYANDDPSIAYALGNSTCITNPNNKEAMTRINQFVHDLTGAVDSVPVDTPVNVYPFNVERRDISIGDKIIPHPTCITELNNGNFNLNQAYVSVSHDDKKSLKFEIEYLENILRTINNTNINIKCQNLPIKLKLKSGKHANKDYQEAYKLKITCKEAIITAYTSTGIFYGIQTLRQLIPVENLKKECNVLIPSVLIKDFPHYSYRSMLVDSARHFISYDEILKQIDIMAAHKYNNIHLHLSDDQGWRLEIPGIDELITYGSNRAWDPDEKKALYPSFGHTNNLADDSDNIIGKPKTVVEANSGVEPKWQGFETATINFVGQGDGYYTREQFKKILVYANQRHIRVIPEIDGPSHARSEVKSMEYRYQQYKDTDPIKASEYRLNDPNDTNPLKDANVNPCLESTYNFFTKVVREIKKMYDEVRLPLEVFHLGGDEVPAGIWDDSPICQQSGLSSDQLYFKFIQKYNAIINSVGARSMGWTPAAQNELEENNPTSTPLKDSGHIVQVWLDNAYPPQSPCPDYLYPNQGFTTVLSNQSSLYNMAYAKHPDEIGAYYASYITTRKVFNFAPEQFFMSCMTVDAAGDPDAILTGQAVFSTRVTQLRNGIFLSNKGKTNVIGLEFAIWGEATAVDPWLDYQAWPRGLALIERAWVGQVVKSIEVKNQTDQQLQTEINIWDAEVEALYKIFANALGQRTLPLIDVFWPKTNYRISVPGAISSSGLLLANVEFPGLFSIEYSLDDGATWLPYFGITAPGSYDTILLRTKSYGGLTSRIGYLYPNIDYASPFEGVAQSKSKEYNLHQLNDVKNINKPYKINIKDLMKGKKFIPRT